MWTDSLRTWFAARWPWRERTLGQRGEDAAAHYLKRQGYRIVGRGERNRLGEIDIVAVLDRTVVFVEVKTLTSLDHGSPADRVTPDKQRRLTRLALAWLKRHRLLEHPTRFDIVAILWPADSRQPAITHYPAAFDARGFDGMFS